MSGARARTTAGRRSGRRLIVRLALALAAAALVVTGTPGLAAAAPRQSVEPLLDCVGVNRNGTFTLVLGYDNTWGKRVHIPYGWKNEITPSRFDGTQPRDFEPGVVHGAFSVTGTFQDLRGSWPRWELDGNTLDAFDLRWNICPPGTEMPADGNGTGAAIALGVAAIVGVLLVYRTRRRTAGRAPTSDTEDTRA